MISVTALLGYGTDRIGGCEIYRVTMPLAMLARRYGWDVQWLPLDHAAAMVRAGKLADIVRSDLYILPRLFTVPQEQDSQAFALIELLHTMNKKVVYEVDDDFTNKHRKVFGGGEGAMAVARRCDALTVSTPHLKKVMQAVSGLETKPIYVVPNCVDPTLWFTPEQQVELPRPVIGLTGSTTHYHDWKVLADVMPGILRDYPDVTFLLGGFHPDYFDDLPEDRVLRQPGVRYPDYAATIKNCDIVLCPVDPDDEFNKSKSAIKAVEGMAAARWVGKKLGGATVIATDVAVYRRVVQQKHNGLLVEHRQAAWDSAIRRVLNDYQLRIRLQINALRWARQHRDISQEVSRWRRAYRLIVKE